MVNLLQTWVVVDDGRMGFDVCVYHVLVSILMSDMVRMGWRVGAMKTQIAVDDLGTVPKQK